MNSNILDTIGKTPLIKVDGIYVKLEAANPSGSIKDRMAWYLVNMAEKRGDLKPRSRILEVTSGNTGISLAMISSLKGYGFTAVMPETKNNEKQKIIESYGAKVILTPMKEDMAGAMKVYEKLLLKNKKDWLPRQFNNMDNVAAYREGLGREIVKEMNGRIDAFITGAGTGGTIIGIAQALKANDSRTKIIVIEPAESNVLSGGKAGAHKIQGIGEGFIPRILKDHIKLIDEVIVVKSQDAIAMSKNLARKNGMLVGVSSGANMWAAKQLRKKYNRIVTVFPDRKRDL